MASEKLVKCQVCKRDAAPSMRYIPQEVFDLWQYLMTSKHGFEVGSEVSSLWMDEDEAGAVVSSADEVDEVNEVVLLLFDKNQGMFRRVCRYYGSDESENLKENLVSHFEKTADATLNVAIKKGVWIRRPAEKSDPVEISLVKNL